MAEAFDKEIEGYRTELEAIINHMEKTRLDFVEMTTECLIRWYETHTRFYVQDQYELTLELGAGRLSQMKKKLMQLVNIAPASVQRILDDDRLWWHRSREGGWRNPFIDGPPEPLAAAIKRLGALLTPILLEFGFIKPNPDVTSVEKTAKPAKWRRAAVMDGQDERGSGRVQEAAGSCLSPRQQDQGRHKTTKEV